MAAWDAGVRVFDAAAAGLGGCPFAPGATGNVATEDLVWMFHHMGIETGIDLDRLILAADSITQLPGAQIGGRSEQHTSELQSLMRISYAVFCLKKKTKQNNKKSHYT